MLHRGRTGAHRVLANEEELEAMLAKRGFEIVDPAKSTALEIAEACAGARIALGVEGSQLTHAFLAMADRAAIVAMIPPYRYINHYKDLTDCIGTMRYGSTTGTAVEDGFRIDPDELLHLLDRVETALDSSPVDRNPSP
jgi:capsular polysaccharide biosynthesis protein